MSQEEAKEEGKGGDEAPKKKLSLLPILLGMQILGLLAATGLIVKAAFFTKGPDLSESRLTERAIASVQDDMDKIKLLDLQEFRVNLPKNHILKANIQLEVSDPNTVTYLNTRMASIKSSVLEVLSGQSIDRTSTFQGKLALKEAIRDSVNKEISMSTKKDIEKSGELGVVRDVYFVDFVLK